MTTHIIAGDVDKKLLKLAGSADNSIPPYIVTKDWLIDSILNGQKSKETYYLPRSFQDLQNSLVSSQSLSLARKSSMKYSTVFKKVTFCIIKESYTDEEVNELTEKIISNSGAVVSEHIENSCAKYAIQNDGYHKWKGLNSEKDEITGKYHVSHRFLDECLKAKKLISIKRENAIHLIPFCYKPPIADFKNICVAFTLYESKGNEIQILQNIAELIGMKVEFTEENTTHLVVSSKMKEYINTKSMKVNTIRKTFTKRKPLVVSDEWFSK